MAKSQAPLRSTQENFSLLFCQSTLGQKSDRLTNKAAKTAQKNNGFGCRKEPEVFLFMSVLFAFCGEGEGIWSLLTQFYHKSCFSM